MILIGSFMHQCSSGDKYREADFQSRLLGQ
jgi:hypothetical protein